jgi:hypothetical protein
VNVVSGPYGPSIRLHGGTGKIPAEMSKPFARKCKNRECNNLAGQVKQKIERVVRKRVCISSPLFFSSDISSDIPLSLSVWKTEKHLLLQEMSISRAEPSSRSNQVFKDTFVATDNTASIIFVIINQ